MIIHLKKNEKLFINGAVIKLDRRGSIELLNDAQFLLASHVLQVEDAKTPLRRLYFIVQTMLVDPANSELTCALLQSQVDQLLLVILRPEYVSLLKSVQSLVERTEYYEALKLLRKNFSQDDTINAPVNAHGSIHQTSVETWKAA
jgi:flagellar biosynthesis repressor protein FlbT